MDEAAFCQIAPAEIEISNQTGRLQALNAFERVLPPQATGIKHEERTMRKLQIIFLLSSLVFATGCPKYRPGVDFNRQGLVKNINDHFTEKQKEYFKALGDNDLATARLRRNELIEDALPYIDEAYIDFTTSLLSGRDRDNFLLDVIDLGTTAAVGITRGERSLQILGVALTAFRGGRHSADLNFFKEQTTPVLITKMDGNRAKVRAEILTRENEQVTTYPIGAAIGHIVAYYNAGTLVRALTELQNDTSATTKASEAEVDRLMKAAGVRGAVTAEHLKTSRGFTAAVRGLRVAYVGARKKVSTAQDNITTANQKITDAGTAISAADQAIGAAKQQIAAAGTNATKKAEAEAAQAKAEAAKSKAEADKIKAESDKTAAETSKTEAVKARDEMLNKLQAVFDAISADSELSPHLDESIEADDTLAQAEKVRKRSILQHLRQKPAPTTDAEKNELADEYTEILFQFGGRIAEMVDTDPSLATRLREILNANK